MNDLVEPFPRLSLVVADDYPLFVEGLVAHIQHDPRFTLKATASDGPGAVAVCAEHEPDVALVGYHLPILRGVALLDAIRAATPATRIAAVAGVVDPEVVHEAVAVGAHGYLIKQEDGPTILDALARIGQGATAFSQSAESCLVEAVRSRGETSDSLPSSRELQILAALSRGATSREVGEELYVSEATVKTHLRRVYEKLEVSDRAAAVASAIRRGWIT